MNKETVIRKARTFFENKIKAFQETLAATRKMVADAPGRIASRYDTSREETGWLADGQTSLLNEWRHNLAALALLPVTPCDRVQAGSLCRLRRMDQPSGMVCLICPGGAGFDCEIDGQTVTFISPASPLARAAAGKGSGSIFSLNGKVSYLIEEVR